MVALLHEVMEECAEADTALNKALPTRQRFFTANPDP
jgi:hypothetical protein